MVKLTPINAGTQYATPLPHNVAEAAATDAQTQRRRERESSRRVPNPERRSLYDLLFYELEQLAPTEPSLRHELQSELRDLVQRQLERRERRREEERRRQQEQRRHDQQPPVLPAPDGATTDQLAEVEVPDEDTFRQQQLLTLSRPESSAEERRQILAALHLAAQVRACLALNTESARRISLYLRAMMVLDSGHFRPHTIIEV